MIVNSDEAYDLQNRLELRSSIANMVGYGIPGGTLAYGVGIVSTVAGLISGKLAAAKVSAFGSIGTDLMAGIAGLLSKSQSAEVLKKAQYSLDWQVDLMIEVETWKHVNQVTNETIVYTQFSAFGIKRPRDENYTHVPEDVWYCIQLITKAR